MAGSRDFGRRIRNIGIRVEKNADAMVRRVALAIDATVVLATPVDTGRARSNWQVQVGSAPAGVREPFSSGEHGSTGAANAQAAIEQGKSAIAAYRSGKEIHIANNLPYIGKLNEGHSAQAPAAFVERAVLVGVQAAQSSGGILE